MRWLAFSLAVTLLGVVPRSVVDGALVVDHNNTNMMALSEEAIHLAKSNLHIAYGHTSHGSQLTSGMSGLVQFANNGGLGLSLPEDIFAWNNGGTDGALDLEEGDGYGNGWLDHDAGYYPNWINETRAYLDAPSHADVNVMIWSWCGQVAGLNEQAMNTRYLEPMSQFEVDYPDVHFVYMTGHLNGGRLTDNLALRNQQIRDYVIAQDKILYDFADIESWDPDGAYYGDKLASDNCDYDSDGDGTRDRNWAIDWQGSHTEGTDWYACGCAHSKALNCNQKGYAAWSLWTQIVALDAEPALGDVNLDGEINGLDVDPFVAVLLNGPYQPEADMNDDQVVNGLDVDPFVAAVVGSGTQPVPEPSTLLFAVVALGVVSGWRKCGG